VAAAVSGVLADALARGLGDRDWSDSSSPPEARAGRPLTLGEPA
jgi:hypothetical protein